MEKQILKKASVKKGVDQVVFDFTEYGKETITSANLSCIQNTLPELFAEQQNDVLLAEKRFLSGKGWLCTNGTGSGKTFTGLGIIKRFVLRKKANVLILVPTDKKAKDWITEALHLDLHIFQLETIQSAKPGITVTTYANFYQNEAILKLTYDLIIYDESHYLLQNADGNFTQALSRHIEVANLPSKFHRLYTDKLRNLCMYYSEKHKKSFVNNDKFVKLYNDRLSKYLEKTKVVFLSATPFAYHKSLLIGDGTLWNIHQNDTFTEDQFHGYNSPGAYDDFFIKNFGYSMRYNKLTRPDAEINVGLMEREFHEKYKELGIISGRKIEVNKDYSREFITLDSSIGESIDEGKKLLYSKEFRENYPLLNQFCDRKFSYMYTNQLLECIKAQEVIPRIKQHLALQRKVIIFHNFNNSLPSHPFKFIASQLLRSEDELKKLRALKIEISRFETEYKYLLDLNLDSLANCRLTLNNAFLNIVEFNGEVSKTRRAKYIDLFNNPQSGVDIILVQKQAGKEGISMHDIIGNRNRVLINLGLPTAPTDAIQIEGRPYRIGVKSNTMFEYATLQTAFEAIAFADKVASRSRTAENLAMGNLARDLETVFIEGYNSANSNPPSLSQGTGGKASDFSFSTITEFEKAKTYYYSNQKVSSNNKSSFGIDYFATPEPLGYTMVRWLNNKPGDSLLEPSAGHGAIGRFFPEDTTNTFIEPNYNLVAKLSLNVSGEVKQESFENLSKWNKYNGIVMNPPFGTQSKLAMEHVSKACNHLSDHSNSKVIAIVPCGASLDKRLNRFLDDKENKDIQFTTEIILPSILFKRAGTAASTKIIILEKNSTSEYTKHIDLSKFDTINDFFDTIENLEI